MHRRDALPSSEEAPLALNERDGNPDTGYELVPYRMRRRVHHIQARKAWEDTDTWRAATVIDESDGVVILAVGDWETRDHVPDGPPAWVNERWKVMAFPSERGNVIPTGLDADGSIFERGNAGRLQFVGIETAGEPAPDEDLLWCTLRHFDDIDRLLIAPRADMRYITDLAEVMTTSATWGEVRKNASRDLYEEIMIRSGRGSLEEFVALAEEVAPLCGYEAELAKEYERRDHSLVPADDEPFDPEAVEGWIIGDWPPMIEAIMDRILPKDLADRHGHRIRTVINGDYLHIPAEHAGPVIKSLRESGFRCRRDRVPFIRDMFRFEEMPAVFRR